jgi:thiol-disulfide isomerase/thioredoxin
MKKRVIVLMLFVLFTGIFSLYCSKPPENVLTKRFENLSKEMNQKLKTIRTREQYNNLLKDRENSLLQLSKEFENKKLSKNDKLTLGKIFIEIKRYDAAAKIFETLLKETEFKKKAIIGIIEVYLNKRDIQNTSKYLDIAKKEFKDNLKDFAPYFLIGGLNQRSKEKSIEYFEIAFKYRLTLPFSRYIGYGIDGYAEAKGLNKDDKLKLIEKIKTLYAGDPTVIKQLVKKEAVIKLIGGPAAEINVEADWINSVKPLTLSRLKGKYIVLEFFAPWCPHCRNSLPHMIELYKKLKSKGLMVIGVTSYYGSYSDGEKKVGKVTKEKEFKLIKEFIERKKVNFPVMITKSRELGDKYGVEGIPCFILISKEGKVLKRYEGAIPTLYGEIEQIVTK